MKISYCFWQGLWCFAMFFTLTSQTNATVYTVPKTPGNHTLKSPFIFGAASYGKSFINEVENPKIYRIHSTISPKRLHFPNINEAKSSNGHINRRSRLSRQRLALPFERKWPPTITQNPHRTNNDSIAFKSLVINEVMAAPKKDNPLPYAEYVEIFNASDKPIELEGFYLKDAKKTARLPAYEISPEEYLILVDEDDAKDFESFGKVLPLSSWPGYTNSQGEVYLCDDRKTIIDSLAYSTKSNINFNK